MQRHRGSTMPHKRNPEVSEQVVLLSRLTRALVGPALEGMVQEHDRDYRGTRLEWVVVADVTHYTLSCLALLRQVLGTLQVFPERMSAAARDASGLALLEALMFALATDKEAARLRDPLRAEPGARGDRSWTPRSKTPKSGCIRPGDRSALRARQMPWASPERSSIEPSPGWIGSSPQASKGGKVERCRALPRLWATRMAAHQRRVPSPLQRDGHAARLARRRGRARAGRGGCRPDPGGGSDEDRVDREGRAARYGRVRATRRRDRALPRGDDPRAQPARGPARRVCALGCERPRTSPTPATCYGKKAVYAIVERDLRASRCWPTWPKPIAIPSPGGPTPSTRSMTFGFKVSVWLSECLRHLDDSGQSAPRIARRSARRGRHGDRARAGGEDQPARVGTARPRGARRGLALGA